MSQIITNFDNFTFRSHYMGELMTPAREKSNLQKYNETLDAWSKKQDKYFEQKNKDTKAAKDLLADCDKLKAKAYELEKIKDIPIFSESCKTRLIQIYTEATTGRVKNIQSKYFEKGLHTEEDGITMYSLYKGQMFRKNKQRRDNGFIQGELDFEENEDISVDNKSSWDAFTFDKVAIKPLNKDYEWQGQCYCWLWNKKIHRVAYTLLNTPEFLIKSQLKKIEYELPEDQWEEAKKEVRRNNIFDDLPLERRIRIFEIKRNDTSIDQIKASVPHWRYFLNNIKSVNMTEDDTE